MYTIVYMYIYISLYNIYIYIHKYLSMYMYSYMFIETHDLLLTPLVSRDLGSVDLAGECGASLPDPLQQLLRIYVLVTWRFLEPAKPR